MLRNHSFLLSILLFLTCTCTLSYAVEIEHIITVRCEKDIGKVNKKVFGSAFRTYELKKWPRQRYVNADYGTGVWDPKHKKAIKEVIELAKSAGLSIIRFAGDNWKDAIGKKREHFLFGIDEYMSLIKDIQAEPLFLINYYDGDEQNAANFVEYLNLPSNGANPWAQEREKNGHIEPYGVKYFEFGNEVWSENVSPEEYANSYLSFQKAMKKVDPSIQLGAVIATSDWNRKLLEVAGDKVDFMIFHTYPPHPNNRHIKMMGNRNKGFKIALALPMVDDDMYFNEVLELLKEITGRTDVKIAVTEFNVGFGQKNPMPYRHSLGAALMNAELIRIFMKPENNVLMANNWHFINSHYGMIQTKGNYINYDCRRPLKIIKRPTYYVYELYNKHFGDMLLDTEVKGSTYSIKGLEMLLQNWDKRSQYIKSGVTIKKNLLRGSWKIRNFHGVNANEKNGVLELDLHNPVKFNYFHSSMTANVKPGTYYKLSGYIKADGLIDEKGFCLAVADGRGWDKTRSATCTINIKGTTNWTYVGVIYGTLRGAETVKVMARRIGNYGPLKGKVYFRDVRLEEFSFPNIQIPYLSVNASINESRDKVYLIVVNKHMHENITASIELQGFPLSVQRFKSNYTKADAWTLNGPSVIATNEQVKNNVKVTHRKIGIDGSHLDVSFEPHSVTAIEIGLEEHFNKMVN